MTNPVYQRPSSEACHELPDVVHTDFVWPWAELMQASGSSHKELARRMGFRNLGRGMHFLWEIERGERLVPDSRIASLAEALDMSCERIRQANADTLAVLAARADQARRLAFRLHLIWIPERERVAPMFLGLMLLRPVYLDCDMDDAQCVARAIQLCPASLPLWGAVRGFWINYSPDRAVAYDLDGEIVAERPAMFECRSWLALR